MVVKATAKANGATGVIMFGDTEDFRVLRVGPQEDRPALPMVYVNRDGLK